MQYSAGLIMYRLLDGEIQVLLVHPGGPYWKKKEMWTFPRGNVEAGEDFLSAAIREFSEETSLVPAGPFIPLGEVRHRSGKRIRAWAFAGTCDPALIRSNTFEMEWPPRSGRRETFPEIDRADFFSIALARRKILSAEEPLLDRLLEALS